MSAANTENTAASAGGAPHEQPRGRGGKLKIVAKVLLCLVVLVAGFAAFVAAQPADFRVTRSAAMSAPPSRIFAQVNDFHNWEAWSPWAKLDPAAKNTFEGPSAGPGAIFKWSGNDEVGEGSMTLIDSRPSDLITIKLQFVRPFEDTQTSEFTFVPDGDQTIVTWSIFGEKNFVSKAVCLFMNMDKMLGGEFEKGLAKLKSVVEAAPEASEEKSADDDPSGS
ncbi:MAG TPA: SRPBCC family protein [Planctomycetaceae bacterium]|nr:SRPBCC family protein [Planctomycetaceae bacterium]